MWGERHLSQRSFGSSSITSRALADRDEHTMVTILKLSHSRPISVHSRNDGVGMRSRSVQIILSITVRFPAPSNATGAEGP